MTVQEIPIPPNHIMMKMSRDFGSHTSTHEYYFDKKEFIEFWQPLTQYIMEIENDIPNSIQD
jgi:hypothetical protein